MEAAVATRDDTFLERRFRIRERGSTPRIELLGGVSTFLTMCYILFVNPAILSAAGVPFRAVAVGTALAACVTTAAMALLTNYPFALAPGLGLNAVVAFDIIVGHRLHWPVGMACIVLEGVLAFVLVLVGMREAVMRAIPLSMKLAIRCMTSSACFESLLTHAIATSAVCQRSPPPTSAAATWNSFRTRFSSPATTWRFDLSEPLLGKCSVTLRTPTHASGIESSIPESLPRDRHGVSSA